MPSRTRVLSGRQVSIDLDAREARRCASPRPSRVSRRHGGGIGRPRARGAGSGERRLDGRCEPRRLSRRGIARQVCARRAISGPSRVGGNSINASVVWVVAEVATSEPWTGGGEATVTLVGGGASVSTARATMAPGSRVFRVALTPGEPLAPGDYQVRVRARGAGDGGAAFDDLVTLAVAASSDPTGGLLVRRGPSTGNKSLVRADLRSRRNERLGIEVPARASDAVSIRLLDRTGKPLAVPMAVVARDDADGSKWQTGELALCGGFFF